MTLLTVVATLKAKPGNEEQVREILLSLVDPSRKEAGCMLYDPHLSTETAGEFVFVEKWSDREALDLHMQSPHFKAASQRLDSLLTEAPVIRTYQRLA